MTSVEEKDDLPVKKADSEGEGEEEKEEVKIDKEKKPYPITVVYCPKCGLPPEYCSYGPEFEKCKPWLKDNFPELYPEIFNQNPEKKGDEKSKEEKPAEEKPAVEKKKKVKITEDQKITIWKAKRQGKKYLTYIQGIEKYDLVIKDVSKKLGKKFACGSSVVDNVIEIQGDIVYEVIEYLSAEYKNITEKHFQVKEKK